VENSLRKVLAESYIAPVAIAILMARAIIGVVEGLALPVGYEIYSGIVFVLNAVTEREMPSTPRMGVADLVIVLKNMESLEVATACAIASWLLARLVFGQGPMKCMRVAWPEIRGRLNAASLEKSAGR
jgi:hypothetical protein